MTAALFYSSSQVPSLKITSLKSQVPKSQVSRSQDDYLDMVLILVIAYHILQFFTQVFLIADKKSQMATGVQSHIGQVVSL